MTKKSFIKGAAILGVAGIIIKILGALYRIPLANLLTDEGMGYYQSSYPIYVMLFALSTAGIPTALAKLVAEKRAKKDYKGEGRVFHIAFICMVILGIVSSFVMFFGAKYFVKLINNPNAYWAMVALTPACFFVPVMSAFRGYFQGRQEMTPLAISQIFEQLFRITLGLITVYFLLDYGNSVAAGGAAFGSSYGGIFGFLIIYILYLRKRKVIIAERELQIEYVKEPLNRVLKDIFFIAFPITMGAMITPIMSFIDTTLIMNQLTKLGYTVLEADRLYGRLSGMAQTFINLPQVISLALAISLVPAISEKHILKQHKQTKRLVDMGLRVTAIVGLPCAFGLFVLSEQIVKLLYFANPSYVQESVGSILAVLSFAVIFLTLMQSLNAILQGIGKQIVPVYNLVVAAIVKAILTYFLVQIPQINIYGAAISTIIAYAIVCVLDILALKKYMNYTFDLKQVLVRPMIATLGMTATAYITFNVLNFIISEKIATLLAIGVAAVVYIILLFLCKAIQKEDLKEIGKGKKLIALFERIGLIK